MSVKINLSLLQNSTVKLLKSVQHWSEVSDPSYIVFRYTGYGRLQGIAKGVLDNPFVLTLKAKIG